MVIFIFLLAASLILSAVVIIKNFAALGDEIINMAIPLLGTLIGTFFISKIVPNKRYVAVCMILFGAVITLFMLLNILSLHLSGTVAASPICLYMFLKAAVINYNK